MILLHGQMISFIQWKAWLVGNTFSLELSVYYLYFSKQNLQRDKIIN